MNRRQAGLKTMWAAACALLVASLGAYGQTSQPAVATSRPALSRGEIESVAAQLVHPQFKIREQASRKLGDVSDDTLAVLADVYRSETRLELRLRIREAIETVFYRKLLEGRLGFLGVAPREEINVIDPVSGKAGSAVLVARVLPGFPAEKAGMHTGDLILDVDGRSVAEILAAAQPQRRGPVVRVNGMVVGRNPSDPRMTAFTAVVSRREPGTPLPMRLLRCSSVMRTIPVTVAPEPRRTLEGAKLVATMLTNPREPADSLSGPSMRPGLFVASVDAGSAAEELGLRAGDLLLGMGGVFTEFTALAERLAGQLSAAKPGFETALLVSRLEQVHLVVMLGGRPVDRMNPEDMDLAQGRFADWWRAHTAESSFRNSTPVFWSGGLPLPPNTLPDATVLP